jgi:hypothetical protein
MKSTVCARHSYNVSTAISPVNILRHPVNGNVIRRRKTGACEKKTIFVKRREMSNRDDDVIIDDDVINLSMITSSPMMTSSI